MSKYVKNLVAGHLRQQLSAVGDAVLVDLTGMNANTNHRLRRALRQRNIHLMVVKNSLARRATEGTALAAAFQGLEGPSALVWGGEDVVTLAKEITRLTKDRDFAPLSARGGVMDGARITAEEVERVSKWPSRDEQLSIVLGQILSPGARLVAQLTAAGGALASQIESRCKDTPDDSNEPTEPATTG